MKFEVVNDFFEKMVDRIDQTSDHGYPHDILIDVTELSEIPPHHTVFIFVKEYISTGMINIPQRIHEYQDIKNVLGLISHYMREIESYKTSYVFFNGVMSERDVSVFWCRKYILDCLWFFAQRIYRQLWDLTDEQKEEIERLFVELKRIYKIRIIEKVD